MNGAAEPNPALKHRLTPDAFDQVEGNSAIYCLKAMSFLEQTAAAERIRQFREKNRKAADEQGVNTVFFVEAKLERAVPWTAPLDYEYLPANPADGLAIGADGQFLCALGDGSVQLLPGNLPKETLLHLFQMNDGQPINLP